MVDIQTLLQMHHMKIKAGFQKSKEIDSPALQEMLLLLEAIGEDGLKLTATGAIPPKIVETIAQIAPSQRSRRYLKFHNRFLESQQLDVIRTRSAAEHGKLIKKERSKLLLSKKGKKFLTLSKAEQFINLFEIYLNMSTAMFDGYSHAPWVERYTLLMLQIIRDRSDITRDVEVFASLLLHAANLSLEDEIDSLKDEIDLDSDPWNTFVSILRIRVFENTLVALGLLIERPQGKIEPLLYEASSLLLDLLEPSRLIDKSMILNQANIQSFQTRIKDQNLDLVLLHDIFYMFNVFALIPSPSPEEIANTIVLEKRLLGTQRDLEYSLYKDLASCVDMTLRLFTQLDSKESNKEMMPEYEKMLRAIARLLPQNTPHALFNSLHSITFYTFEFLRSQFGIEIMQEGFYEKCVAVFNEELAEDIGALLYSMGELQKACTKSKKIKASLLESAQSVIHNYIFLSLELRAWSEDRLNTI